MKISVLLPVHNGGKLIETAIQSVINQDFDDYEILVIDDASTDGTPALLRRYQQTCARLRVITHAGNKGLAATLNEGLAEASGEYVARLDHDDEALPTRLRIQAAFLDAHPGHLVVGSYVYHMGATRRHDRLVTLPESSEDIAATLPKYNCMYHPAIMLRRQAILDMGGYREAFRNAEDYDLWLRVSKIGSMANIPSPLIRYRFSLGGLTLGRKWEQLLYVYMAQLAHRRPEESLERIHQEAEALRAETDRGQFFNAVLAGTAQELVRLGLWADTCRLVWRLRTDIDLQQGCRTAFNIFRQHLSRPRE
jgi:glycosyltransferase involved in cell wall biosynthesis